MHASEGPFIRNAQSRIRVFESQAGIRTNTVEELYDELHASFIKMYLDTFAGQLIVFDIV